ncbi:hypothetical protein VPHD479_0148 [Vibrio phage D479]
MNPQQFIDKFNSDFLPLLVQRLESDPQRRGGKVVFVGPANIQSIRRVFHANGQQIVQNLPPVGFDVVIEDKNGKMSTFYVDPTDGTFMQVRA